MVISVCTSTHSRFSSDHFLSSCSSRDRPLSGDELMLLHHSILSDQPTRAAGRQASTPLTGATHTACSLESRWMVVVVVVVMAPRWIHLKGKHDIARVRRHGASPWLPKQAQTSPILSPGLVVFLCNMLRRTSLRLQESNDLTSRSGGLLQRHT